MAPWCGHWLFSERQPDYVFSGVVLPGVSLRNSLSNSSMTPMACAEPFKADDLYSEITSASPYAALERDQFDRILDFVATGGYALKTYDRYARIRLTADGTWRVSNPRIAQQYRLNIGTIIEAPELKIRLTRHSGRGANVRGGPVLGKIEESFVEMLAPGDTFLFAGKVLRFEGIRENECIVSKGGAGSPKIPAYAGGKFPLSTYLADQVRSMNPVVT